ncbi:MAG: hypothetical protein ABIV06_08865 [Thermoanaerobaculia bacterium]
MNAQAATANRPRDRRPRTLLRSLGAFFLVLAMPSVSCAGEPPRAATRALEPVVGLPCEGCEAVFIGLPEALAALARIAPANEPGEPLQISGTVLDGAGNVAIGVIVYAYQTDARGHYPPDPNAADSKVARHGRLRGWAQTDARGEYRFDTVRPAGYPDTDIPQHVHMHVIEPGRCTYFIDDLLFSDDPRLTAAKRASYDRGRGGSGVATPTRGADGVWNVRRDIRLGEKIPGYSETR